jgi:hypothetical protein
MRIDIELPVSYKKVIHVQRIETEELEVCKPKIIKERKGIRGLFKPRTKIIHMNEIFGSIDYWEM